MALLSAITKPIESYLEGMQKGVAQMDDPREKFRRRPTLPPRLQGSTIGAGGLNFWVRNGTRCDPSAMATGNLFNCQSYAGRLTRFVTRICRTDQMIRVTPSSKKP